MTSLPFISRLFNLQGQSALVTGAGRGLGEAIARYLASAGAHVHLVARTRADLEKVSSAIQAEGGSASIHPCDVRDTAAVRSMISGLAGLDILVNNAGTNAPQPMVEVSDENLDLLLDLNVRSMYVVAQAAVRKMLETPGRIGRQGVIIHMSSQMGHVGSPNRTVYCMTKHAIEGLTKAMAVELASQGIRVNSIGPTFVETPLVRQVVDTPEKQAFVLSHIPMGRLATVDEIAAAALYLASPSAAMVTGTCLRVDGGWTAP